MAQTEVTRLNRRIGQLKRHNNFWTGNGKNDDAIAEAEWELQLAKFRAKVAVEAAAQHEWMRWNLKAVGKETNMKYYMARRIGNSFYSIYSDRDSEHTLLDCDTGEIVVTRDDVVEVEFLGDDCRRARQMVANQNLYINSV